MDATLIQIFLSHKSLNNLVYFRVILAESMIVKVSWAVENNLVYFRGILVGI